MPALEVKKNLAINAYYPLYEKLVEEWFLQTNNLEIFINIFNEKFTERQNSRKWVTHPESLKNGFISCGMAALLASIWWIRNGNENTFFAEHLCDRSTIEPHYVVGLNKDDKNQEIIRIRESYLIQRSRNCDDPIPESEVSWIHWLESGKMQSLSRDKGGRLVAPTNVKVLQLSPIAFAAKIIRQYPLPKTKEIEKLLDQSE